MSKQRSDNWRDNFDELMKRRFFYVPSYEIYGGVKGLYDYGPTGSTLQSNMLAQWRQFFIVEENMHEISTAAMTPEIVFLTSGHCEKFEDNMVRDVITLQCYRADHLLEDKIEEILENEDLSDERINELKDIYARADDYSCLELGEQIRALDIKAPDTGNDITDPFPFNLMFSTSIGPTGNLKGYLRPETAQGIFVNFPRLLEYNNGRLPFAGAQIGPAFRNEISPKRGLLRVREFTLAEIEHFIDPADKSHPKFAGVADYVLPLYPRDQQLGDKQILQTPIGEAVTNGVVDNETLGYFLVRTHQFLTYLGVPEEHIRFRQHLPNEMAHYATDCWDAEIQVSYGWIECVGNADRACYDLSVHEVASGRSMNAFVQFPDGPQDVEVISFVANKGIIGKTFRGDSKKLLVALENLSEEELNTIKSDLAENGSTVIAGLTVTQEMLEISVTTEKRQGQKITPSVIEPSFGIGRILYCLLEHSYYMREGSDERHVLSIPAHIAPVQCSVFALVSNDELNDLVTEIAGNLRKSRINTRVDTSGTRIGRKYSRVDEIGCPYCVTVDFDTIEKNTVTLRERDSTDQVLIPVSELNTVITSLVYDDDYNFDLVKSTYPEVEN
eukprot:TRINITY_DN8583_c0_g1_i1.p1 TRINITY_DN8583_c0_g1~~TRINITY_DN8583_c0_g1_i1.p1  ORF type:complete len:614 (-),score=146.92 TRINITY_DN8583_c0_g1_i1:19-1860(-)